jgi:hypothetical protein
MVDYHERQTAIGRYAAGQTNRRHRGSPPALWFGPVRGPRRSPVLGEPPTVYYPIHRQLCGGGGRTYGGWRGSWGRRNLDMLLMKAMAAMDVDMSAAAMNRRTRLTSNRFR